MKFKIKKNSVQKGILIVFSIMLLIMIICSIVKFSILNLLITIFLFAIYLSLIIPSYILSYVLVIKEEIIIKYGYNKIVIKIPNIQDIILNEDVVVYYETSENEYALHMNLFDGDEFIKYVKGVRNENKKGLEL